MEYPLQRVHGAGVAEHHLLGDEVASLSVEFLQPVFDLFCGFHRALILARMRHCDAASVPAVVDRLADMALLHQAELRPSKVELVEGWAQSQPWFEGDAGAGLTNVASFRFD